MRPELAVRARAVALLAEGFGRVEHDRDWEEIVLFGELDQRLACLALHVRGVDDREPRLRQAPATDEVKHRECVGGRRLVVLLVGDQAAAEVRGDHLGCHEVLAREGALARAGRPDENDEARVWELDPHLLNTAICVGGPTSSSTGPTGR